MKDPLREIAARDGRYAVEAFQFVYDALDHVVKRTGRSKAEGSERHVSGQELLVGLREHASALFGPLAGAVWRSWGVHETLDWGRIVFLLVDGHVLNRQENDRLEDFAQGYDFDQVFVRDYRVELPPEVLSRGPARSD